MLEISKNLTEKQKLFVLHYCAGGNPRTAAIAAGFSVKSASTQGSRLLRNAYIHNAIVTMLSEQKKMLNDRYASFFLYNPKTSTRAKVNAAAYFLEKSLVQFS